MLPVVEKIAFTFPGQGRVPKGNGAPWADDPAGWPLERASQRLGWDVIEVIEAGEAILANSNAPGQVVISGESAAVEEAGRRALAAGAKRVFNLPIGGGFHTPLMHAARRPFREALDRIDMHRLEVPLVSNAKAKVVHRGRRAGRLLARQLTSPVDWTGCVERLRSLGATRYVELGPSKVLEGLIRRIDPRAVVTMASTPDEVRALAAAVRP